MIDARREGLLGRALVLFHGVEDLFLVLLLLAVIVLAPLQIFLRNFFDAGISWADPLIRVLVLWLGLFGAVAASRGDRHITIDVASRYFSAGLGDALRLLTSLFTSAVSALIAWHSGRFVIDEREFGSTAFSGIPAWIPELAIPVAFGLIAIRYGLRGFSEGSHLLARARPRGTTADERGDGGASG